MEANKGDVDITVMAKEFAKKWLEETGIESYIALGYFYGYQQGQKDAFDEVNELQNGKKK